jgi:hypothetical protein
MLNGFTAVSAAMRKSGDAAPPVATTSKLGALTCETSDVSGRKRCCKPLSVSNQSGMLTD